MFVSNPKAVRQPYTQALQEVKKAVSGGPAGRA